VTVHQVWFKSAHEAIKALDKVRDIVLDKDRWGLARNGRQVLVLDAIGNGDSVVFYLTDIGGTREYTLPQSLEV
jgi:hypothetical protein